MYIVNGIVSETALYDIYVKNSFYMKEAFLAQRGGGAHTIYSHGLFPVPANYDNLASVV